MTPDPGRVQAIFLVAVEERTSAERSAVLNLLCAGDTALRSRVEALLTAHDRPDHPLDRPAVLGDQKPTTPVDDIEPTPRARGEITS